MRAAYLPKNLVGGAGSCGNAQPGRERLRHLIMGSREGVHSAIKSLHKLNYAEQHLWSQLIAIPASGIVLTPEQGEMFSYLVRDRRLE